MMNKMKLMSAICAAALTVSVAGGSVVSALAAGGEDAALLKGKVTDIEGTTVTLELGGPMDGRMDGGMGQQPPAKPDGDTQDDLTPPAKPDGDTQDDLTPPAKADGDAQDDLTPPAKPIGDEQDGQTPPEKPEDGEQPAEAKSVEVDVSGAAITEDGEDAALEDIEVGDMVTVELDENGSAVSVSIDNLPAMDGAFDPDKQPASDDDPDPSQKPEPIDGAFGVDQKPADDGTFDPSQKPADGGAAPDGQPVIDGAFTVADRPAPDGGFGGMMQGGAADKNGAQL